MYKKIVLAFAFALLSLNAFSQLKTTVKIENSENSSVQEAVEITVTWHLSDGTIKTGKISVPDAKDGDYIDVPFSETSTEATIVTNTDVPILFLNEDTRTNKKFQSFKFVTCSFSDDKWIIPY
jgi:hypothetical protein